MTAFYLIGVILSVVAVAVWLAWRMGRTGAEKRSAEASVKVKDKQIEAALDRPDKSELADKLRNGKF